MTIEKVYGVPFEQLKPPDGYRFRMMDGKPVLKSAEHEAYVLMCDGTVGSSADVMGDIDGTRLVLEPIERTAECKKCQGSGALIVPTGPYPEFSSDECDACGGTGTVEFPEVRNAK